jgi:O-antigen ligase
MPIETPVLLRLNAALRGQRLATAAGSARGKLRSFPALRVRRDTLAGVVVAAAMLSSCIVFSEPAIADALMAAVMVAVPVLGVGRVGGVSLINFLLWVAIVALGTGACAFSATFDTALKHQLVTLFLAGGAFAIAAYVAADPLPRFKLIMWCYTVSCIVATLCALAGYFQLIPGTYELFTNYGRARGTFKDPNVYSAALAPALAFMTWNMLRADMRSALLSAGIALLLAVGLLVSFSRGAWLACAAAIAMIVWVLVVRSRRRADFFRLGTAGMLGTLGLAASLLLVMQIDTVRSLLEQRASLDQSYDSGPDGRFGGQEKARQLILENPFGIGTHTFRDVYHHEEPHNVYLSMFLNAGWVGGLLYVASVFMTAAIGLRYAMKNGYRQGPFLVAGSTFSALAFEGYVIDTDHWRHVFLMMGCVWGLADAELRLWVSGGLDDGPGA